MEPENIYGLSVTVFVGGVWGMFAVVAVQPDPANCGNDSAMVLCCQSHTRISCRLRRRTRTESEQAFRLITWFKPLMEGFFIKKPSEDAV